MQALLQGDGKLDIIKDKTKPKGQPPKKSILDSIAVSAINSKITIFPVGDKKSPLIHGWQKDTAGSYDKETLEQWRLKYKNPYWGMPCGPVNNVICVDVDFQKDKNKKPIGWPIIHPVDTKMLSHASFTQNTMSEFEGQKTSHHFFKWEDRLKIFTNIRLKPTTIDIRTRGGQVVLYRTLPPLDIWEDLSPMPDVLFEALKKLLGKNKRTNVKGNDQWEVGDRNNTLFKKIASDMQRNQGRGIPLIIEEAKQSGLGKEEIDKTTESAIKTAIKSGIDPGPQHPNTKAKTKQKRKYKRQEQAENPFSKMDFTAPEPEPPHTEQDKDKVEDLEVLLFKKEKIVDTDWGIEDWFEYGDLAVIGGEAGSGKTTLAIKFAVMNALGRPFWVVKQDIKDKDKDKEDKKVFIPKGDKRKSLYLCFERKPSKAFNKEVACGGDGDQIDIVTELKNKKDQLVPIDLENPTHLKAILNMIRKNDYWSVIIDPIVDLVLSSQNDNAKVRRQVALLLKETHGIRTIFFGIAHLRKQRQGVSDMGALRGASEIGNMATSVCRVFELKDDEGFILTKLKINESKIGTKGGIKYKIENLEIHESWRAEGSKEISKGGIRLLEYYHKSREEIKKGCVEELPDKKKPDPRAIISYIIKRLKAEEKELNTTVIKNLAFAEGVTTYFIQQKLNWRDFGYKSVSAGQGKDYRIILVPDL